MWPAMKSAVSRRVPTAGRPGLAAGDAAVDAAAAVVHGLEARTPRPAALPPRPRRQSRSIQSWAWCWQRLVVDGGGLLVTALASAAVVAWVGRSVVGPRPERLESSHLGTVATGWVRKRWRRKHPVSQPMVSACGILSTTVAGMQAVTFAAARSRSARPARSTGRNLPDKQCGRNGTQESASG